METSHYSDIEKYTVAIYSEHQQELKIFGSGILIKFQDLFFLVSAHHVLEREKEHIRIQNDPFEEGIPQDNVESFFAKCKDGTFFYVNDVYQGLVFTTKFNSDKNDFELNDDTEFGVCKLDNHMVNNFLESDKSFYELDHYLLPNILTTEALLISGYPKYAQKNNQEIYRSYKATLLKHTVLPDSSLIRINFNTQAAYNYEQNQIVRMPPPKTMEGLSGGGVWSIQNNKVIPLGIILKEDPDEHIIECYRLDAIAQYLNSNFFDTER